MLKLMVILFVSAGFTQKGYCGEAFFNDTLYDTNDLSSVDAIAKALYDVISGPAGQKRDWAGMRSLFIAEGRMIAMGKKNDGSYVKQAMSVDDYIKSSGAFLETEGFFLRGRLVALRNNLDILSIYLAVMKRDRKRMTKQLLCGASIVFSCGMTGVDGGS